MQIKMEENNIAKEKKANQIKQDSKIIKSKKKTINKTKKNNQNKKVEKAVKKGKNSINNLNKIVKTQKIGGKSRVKKSVKVQNNENKDEYIGAPIRKNALLRQEE